MLAIEDIKWIAEIRQLGSTEVGITAILRSPESTTDTPVPPEVIYTLRIQLLSSGAATINCTTVYLSNILNDKIQPRGLVTPIPTLVVDSNPDNDPYVGEVVVAQAEPRGLFSFAEQAQVVNTAVFNYQSIHIGLTHYIAMSSGSPLVPASSVQCYTDSSSFHLSSSCDEIFLNGSETTGADSDVILIQADNNFTAIVLFRVWYPRSGASLEVTPSVLHPIGGWIAPNASGQCTQQYQQATISAFAELSYSQTSPVFIVSILPLLTGLLSTSDAGIIEITEDGTTLKALRPGSSFVAAGLGVAMATVTVIDVPVEISFLEVVLFSGLTLTLPTPPYPLVSTQVASATPQQDFNSITSPVFASTMAVVSDGSTMSLNDELGLRLESLDPTVIQISGGDITLIGGGSGNLVLVTWQSVCTGESIATGSGSIEVTVPDPVDIVAALSSERVTHPGDRASFGGVPTSSILTVSLVFPDGQTRDATDDPRVTLDLSQALTVINVAVTNVITITAVDAALGTVFVSIGYNGLSIQTSISLSVVDFQFLILFSTPHPPYPGSAAITKTLLNRISDTNLFQQVSLKLEIILTDNSTVSVTRSPLTLFETSSSSITISGNVVEATATGMAEVQGQFGTDIAALELTVSNTPVTIDNLVNFTLGAGVSTLTGIEMTTEQLFLDVEFSDSTIYPDFIPDAADIFPGLISLTSDIPSAASVDTNSGVVTLLGNHHSLVTVMATNGQVQAQVSFACNLQPDVGDVDLGANPISTESDSGVPIPPVQEGSTLQIPVYINAGSQPLTTVDIAIVYDTETLTFSDSTTGSGWPGGLTATNTPSIGLISLTGSLVTGVPGLVHLATLTLNANAPGVASIAGLVLTLKDAEGNTIGEQTPREFVAGDVSILITSSSRRRREVRERRNVVCFTPLPCENCSSIRETGDVNGDCILDDNDPIFLLSYLTEGLFDFELPSGSILLSSLISEQEQQFDVDRNTAVDPADVYFLRQISEGILNFLADITIVTVLESPTCTLAINATLLSRGDIPADTQSTTVYFDIALPFDPTLTNQQLLDDSTVLTGTMVTSASKGLTLQGGIFEAYAFEPGVFGIELLTNLTLDYIGLSVIQVPFSNVTNLAWATFGPPDPPYSYPTPLDIELPGMVNVLASNGYNPSTSFNNTVSSAVCLTPPGPPTFNQNFYTATVAENTTLGTVVLVVHAQSQSDFNVTYSIASGDPNGTFTVEPSGELVLSASLDFETQSTHQLVISAEDPATGRSVIAMATITVTDINDNAPTFPPLTPVLLPENTPTGSLVAIVTATDADSGTNSLLMYTIQSDDETFAIDVTLGIITLQRPLNFSTQSQYDVFITASDQGDPVMSSSVLLNVTVLPPDPTVLQFTSLANETISEDAPIGFVVLQLEAIPVTNETGTVVIEYSLVAPVGSPFIVERDSGELRVNASLDRETTDTYELQVSATVANRERAVPAVAVILIMLIDVNDNPPVFLNESYSTTLLENAAAGTLSLSVVAMDSDLGVNGAIQYTIMEDTTFLSIDNSTGVLRNTQPVDYELIQQLLVTVVAYDMGNPPLNSSVTVAIEILDTNDNLPLVSVSPGDIILNELTPPGTTIANVSVQDLDSSSVNGDITISIVPVTPQFSTNISSGEIFLSASLDFETVQSYSLMVAASDNGFSSAVNITVTVLDANDNPPVFTQDTYSIAVDESTPVGTSLLRLNASDADSNENAATEFSLLDGDASQVFNLSTGGILTLSALLDSESTSLYSLQVIASNTAPGSELAMATVEVAVTDINEFPPAFNQPEYEASVMEERAGEFVVQVLAIDMDTTANVTYSLSGNTSGEFLIALNGSIFTARALDRENTSSYVFTVIASDNNQPEMTATAVVMVMVLDINDHIPLIVPFQSISIPETVPIGTTIATFTAVDPDIGDNGMTDFFLLEVVPDFNLSSLGLLSVASPLNATLTSQYMLTVAAQDRGVPPLTSSAPLIITVEPSAVPFFEQTSYSPSVFENDQPNAFLVQVRAQSRDPTVNISYALGDAMFGGLFAVEPGSGNVTTLVSLDRELEDMYTLTVVALADVNATVLSAETTIEVTVLDVNDNPPQFESTNQTARITETTPPGTSIISLRATDVDDSENAIISYSITAGNEDLQFTIDSNGIVRTTGVLVDMTGEYSLLIVASNSPEVGNLSSLTNLTVVVDPVNDFAPQFDMAGYSAQVREDTAVFSILLTVSASDNDTGTAGEVTYAITAGNDGFFHPEINASSGVLALISSLDYEFRTLHSLTVAATDNGTPPRSTSVTVEIIVLDFNDNPPVFTMDTYIGNILENEVAGTPILRVNITDADSADNSQVEFTITPSNLFMVDNLGLILSSEELDREAAASYSLMIEVTNNGTGVVLTDVATVQITVMDVNDNSPQFSAVQYSRVLKAPLAVNTTVVHIQTSDEDAELNGDVRYNLTGSNGTLMIDSLSGMVYVAMEITQETNISVMVTAFDLGTPSLSNQTFFYLTVLPEDDLTAGRELDFAFATSPGLALVERPAETAVDSYQQMIMIGFSVGAPVSEPQTFAASLGPVSSSVSFLRTRLPPSSVQAVLLMPTVWHDSPVVTVATQVRDDTHNVQTDTATIVVMVTHPTEGSAEGNCMASSTTGACVASISIPSSWFIAAANLTVQYGLTTLPPMDLGRVELQPEPTFDINSDIYVYFEMPLRPLFRGDTFTIAVYGEAGVSAVGSFTVSVQTSPDVTFISLSADGEEWLAQSMAAGDGSVIITAVRADQSSIPLPGREELFTITAQVSTSSPVDTLLEGAVNSTVLFLGDSDLVRLLPPPDVDSVLAHALSQNGISKSGAVYVSADIPVSLLPYTSHSELVNTAVLNGEMVTASVTVLGALRSGTLNVLTPTGCTSGNTSVVDISPDCSNVLLTTDQTQPASTAIITINYMEISSQLPVRVWVPSLPLTLTVTDSTLGRIPGWFDAGNSCSPLYQESSIIAFADFTDTLDSVQNIDISDLISGVLVSTNTSVVAVEGKIIRGVSPGLARVRAMLSAPGTPSTEVEITVTSVGTAVLGLDVQILTGLQLQSPPTVERLATATVGIAVEKEFDFEGIQGRVIASAVFDDGSRMLLEQLDGVEFISLDDDVILVVGNTVTVVGSGQGELVEATWHSDRLCSNDSIASGVGEISVELPSPADINIVLGTDVLAPPSSTANMIGLPSNTTLTVLALFADGRTQDLTTDSRTTYTLPDDIIIAQRVLSVHIPTASIGVYSITVSFAQFPELEVIQNVTIVSLDDIVITATPHPSYPGSDENSISALHPIASTRVRQQASITTTAILSNNQSYDISAASLEISASTPELKAASDISDQNILSVSDVLLSGTVTVSATLNDVTSSSPLVIDITLTPVQVTQINISPFTDNTFRGFIDNATRQVVVTVEFNDSTQYVDLFLSQTLPNLVSFSAIPPSGLTIDSNSGLATLRGNSLSPATITVMAIGSGVEKPLSVSCNLDPDVGDVDLGSHTGVPIPTVSAGTTFSIPLRVNSGSAILDSLELDVTFDATILRAVTATAGPDWPVGGIFLSTINDPVDIITVGGTLVGSDPVSGLSLYIADLEFEAIASGIVNISGIIYTLAEQNSGSVATNIVPVPAEFIAGSVQMEVLSSRRRRSMGRVTRTFLSRQRRQSCDIPPCDSCDQFRETGDVDGNCVFDVRDASFLQEYYLASLTTNEPSTLPSDRAQYLDIDLNGAFDPSDVIFMLRVNFRLLSFVTGFEITPVAEGSCEITINVTLLGRGDIPADSTSTALIIDFAHEDPAFQAMFDATNFTSGTPTDTDKGLGHYGGLVETEHIGDGVFTLSALTEFNITDIGVSLIQVTFDNLGHTSDVRTTAMFSQRALVYDPLNVTISVKGQPVLVRSQQGYSPLMLATNNLTSPECTLRALPLTFDPTGYSATIREDTDIGTAILQVNAVTHRPSTSITYSIARSENLPFAIDDSTGEITLRVSLDFESQSNYTFAVLATESPGLFNASAEVVVSVENVNDLSPSVLPIEDLEVPANRSEGDEILRVIASDPDFLDDLVYSIESTTVAGLFDINSTTGIVTAAQSLLESANTSVQLNISVSDGIFTSYTTAILPIYLPFFTELLYTGSISEAAETGTTVVTVAIENTRNEVFAFPSEELAFNISELGDVSVATPLDYERVNLYTFTISAQSSNFILATQVNITILDENDNAPVFSPPVLSLDITASTLLRTTLTQFNATDEDSGTNAAIAYSIAPSPQADFFSIVGDLLQLQYTLLGGNPVINITVIATDLGQPSLNGSLELIIGVMFEAISTFPLPPTLTASRAAFLLGATARVEQPVRFTQDFSLVSGPSGTINAGYGDVSSSVSVTPAAQEAAILVASLLHHGESVYQDGRDLSVVAQVRDQNYFTSVLPVVIQVRVNLVRTMNDTASTCTPDELYGICIVSLTIPEAWFEPDSLSDILLETTINGMVHGEPVLLTLQPQPPVSSERENEVIIELPSRDVFLGEIITANVYASSTYAISGFSLLFSLGSVVEVEDIAIDSNVWSSQTISDGDVFGISAIIGTPSEDTIVATDPVLLFSLRMRSQTSLTISETYDARLSATVVSLSSVVEGSVIIGSSNSTTGPALFIDRDGLSTNGTIYIVPDSIQVLLPWSNQSELLNTAVLNKQAVTVEVLLFAVFVSGQILPYNGSFNVSCSSSNTSVLSVDSACNLVLSGGETSGGDVNVTFTTAVASGQLPLRVYYPDLPIKFNTSDSVLNRIQYTLLDNCTEIYQQATIDAFVDFTAGERRLTNVVVTDTISAILQSSNVSALSVEGSTVQGVRAGAARVCLSLREDLGCIDFIVSSELPVHVSGVSVSVLAELTLETDSVSIMSGEVNTASVGVRSQLEFESERASVLVSVLYSDSAIATVNVSDVILSSAPNTVFAVEDIEVIALTSGQENLQVIWSPLEGECLLEVPQTTSVAVSLPQPVAVRTSLLPPPSIYTLTSDLVAAMAGVATSWRLQVELEFPDGRTLDVTSDPRTNYSASSDLITAAINGTVTATGQGNGLVNLTVQFAHTNLTAVVQFEVVESDDLVLSILPYPPYPGSDTHPSLANLSLIEDTGIWQQATLRLTLDLTNGDVIDVTRSIHTTFTATPVIGSINSQISSESVLTVDSPGLLQVFGMFGSETMNEILTVADTAVRVTAIEVNPLEDSTLTGIADTAATQLTANITLSDGTQLLNLPTNPAISLPGLLTFNTTSTAISVSESGLVQPLENSIIPVPVQAWAGMETATTSFSVNLEPDTGDIDFGTNSGPPLFADLEVGDVLSIPVIVNTGSSNLGAIHIVTTYNPDILEPLNVVTGTDWLGGLYEAVLNDPPGEVRLGGALSVNGVSGTQLHLFSLSVRVVGVAMETNIGGTVVTLSERDIDGNPIGPPTPRDIVAGNITFSVSAGVGKRSVLHSSLAARRSPAPRGKRAAMECLLPPCECSGQVAGDGDGNCVFDVRDVSFTLLYLAESLVSFSRPEGQALINRTTQAQLQQMDANGDGTIDTSDAYFLLRAVFELVHFLQDAVLVTPVQEPNSSCLFSVVVKLTNSMEILGEVEVYMDIAFSDSELQGGFDSSAVVSGSLILADKGPGLVGGLISAKRNSSDVFLVQVNASFVSEDIGISVIMATFDASNTTDASRTALFFGSPLSLYPHPLNVSIPTRESSVLVAALSGYSPRMRVSNTLSSLDCSDIPLLDSELNVTFPSPFQAILEWRLLNMRMGLDFTSQIQVYITSCNVSQNSTCENLTMEVDNNTSHTLAVLPFTDYWFEVRAPTTQTDLVHIRSPEAG